MLKALFRELGKSLSPTRGPKAENSAANPLDQQRAQFKAAPAAERARLTRTFVDELAARAATPDEWTLAGDWQLQLHQLEEAEQTYRHALQTQPMHAKAQEGLGLTLLQLRRLDEAYLHLETAHKLDPMNAEVLTHWGMVDLELGNIGKAADKFRRAVERDPKNPHAWLNLGLSCLKLGQLQPSIQHMRQAVALDSGHVLALTNLALALRQSEQLEEALGIARQATERSPQSARAWVVLGDLQLNAGDFEASQASLQRAQQTDAQHPGTYVALGKLHTACGRYEAARHSYEALLAIQPGHAEAGNGLAQLQLLMGEWSSAWDFYEARRHIDASPVRGFPFLDWQGDDISDRTILVHAEQGLGDIILFAGCLSDLQRKGARCIVEVPKRLGALFERSFPHATIVPHDAADSGLGWLNNLPAIERHIPIGSLPRWFRRDANAFSTTAPYLVADQQKVHRWQRELDSRQHAVIGVSWRGGLTATASRQRSLELSSLLATLYDLDITIVNLQYGEVGAELEQAQQHLARPIHPGLSGYGDLDDLAALTSACDGVITVCSTLAHLTGALGKPGLVLVPANPNWRYGFQGDATPWYPSLQLARQHTLGDWRDPLAIARKWAQGLAQKPSSQEVAL